LPETQIAINEAKMKLRKDRRHLYESIEEGQLGDDGDYIPQDFADWREIPSEALERKELRDAGPVLPLSSRNRAATSSFRRGSQQLPALALRLFSLVQEYLSPAGELLPRWLSRVLSLPATSAKKQANRRRSPQAQRPLAFSCEPFHLCSKADLNSPI
jgi:hypothetical protein